MIEKFRMNRCGVGIGRVFGRNAGVLGAQRAPSTRTLASALATERCPFGLVATNRARGSGRASRLEARLGKSARRQCRRHLQVARGGNAVGERELSGKQMPVLP